MLTQSAALARALAFAEAIRKQPVSLRQVVLFGSYARNEQREYSDIDIALVADEFVGFAFQDVRLISDVAIRPEFVDIEPHMFSPEQFTDWNPFVQEIKRTGIVVGQWEPAATPNPVA